MRIPQEAQGQLQGVETVKPKQKFNDKNTSGASVILSRGRRNTLHNFGEKEDIQVGYAWESNTAAVQLDEEDAQRKEKWLRGTHECLVINHDSLAFVSSSVWRAKHLAFELWFFHGSSVDHGNLSFFTWYRQASERQVSVPKTRLHQCGVFGA